MAEDSEAIKLLRGIIADPKCVELLREAVSPSDVQLIPVREVIRILGICRTEVWRRAKEDPNFPQPTRDMGTRCTRFEKGEVQAYARALLADRKK